MEAGSAISTPVNRDIFDRIGDLAGNALRFQTQRSADHATVFNPLVAISRYAVDPEGTKNAYHNVAKEADAAAMITNPGYAFARFFGSSKGQEVTRAGADAGDSAAKAYVESPLTGFGLLKHGIDYAKSHPDQVERSARLSYDIQTLTNPGVAMVRGIASVFGGH
jgi:hypothetical protein